MICERYIANLDLLFCFDNYFSFLMMLFVKAWSWNNVNSLKKNVNCFTLLKPICACYLSYSVVFILENRQKFCVRVHVEASSVNCHSKDVDSSDCDLCTLVNSELFELWTWVCLTSHLYPVGICARLRLWPSFPVTVFNRSPSLSQLFIPLHKKNEIASLSAW